MRERSYAEYEERLLRQSKAAFERHVLRRNDVDHWRIQCQYPDNGAWDSAYSADIVCTEPRSLVVNGDIDIVAFAHGPEDPRARVRWMGRSQDLGYYVLQKAVIGTGRDVVSEYNSDVARCWLICQIRDRLVELRDDWTEDIIAELDEETVLGFESGDQMILAYRDALEMVDEQHELLDHLYRSGEDDYGSVGIVTAPRVFYAHAALAKLCDLLDALEPQEVKDE